MSKDMFYFSDVQFNMITIGRDFFETKDAVLVGCQQMIETLLKGLLIERDGTCSRTHSLKTLYRSYSTNDYSKYKSLLSDLTDCYFDCRYASDDYIDYTQEEFNQMVDESLELREYLLSLRRTNKNMPESKNF